MNAYWYCLDDASIKANSILWFAKITLTLAGWPRIWVVPSAVGLATDDPSTPVVISQVADEHHDGIILVLSAVDESPSSVIHGRVADVLAGTR